MKVYVTASTENVVENKDLFLDLLEYLRKTGYKNTNLHLSNTIDEKFEPDGNGDIYSNTISIIRNSDLVIVEASYQSISVGFVIERAINLNIPILCLCQNSHKSKLPKILRRYKSDAFTIVYYDKKQIGEVLDKYFSGFKKHKVKLNVFLDSVLDNYLKKRAKIEGLSKSDIVRNLIKEAAKLV